MNLDLGDTRVIIEEARKRGLLRNELAYVLSTAYWETARTMKPVKEAYWLSETWRKNNLRYYPWYGRGYVQLTWEDNYKKAGRILGLDLTTNPDRVMEPKISAQILVVGMKDGWFRAGKKLSNYITLSKSDFKRARDIINGDQSKIVDGERIDDKLARFAREYDKALLKEGYGVSGSTRPTVPSRPEETMSGGTGFWASIAAFFKRIFGGY